MPKRKRGHASHAFALFLQPFEMLKNFQMVRFYLELISCHGVHPEGSHYLALFFPQLQSQDILDRSSILILCIRAWNTELSWRDKNSNVLSFTSLAGLPASLAQIALPAHALSVSHAIMASGHPWHGFTWLLWVNAFTDSMWHESELHRPTGMAGHHFADPLV